VQNVIEYLTNLGEIMKLFALFMLFFLPSCGSELIDKRIPTADLPQPYENIPPIPPITRREPVNPTIPPANPPSTNHSDYDKYLNAARRQYPQIVIQEDGSSNAKAGYYNGRYTVTIGRGLRRVLPPSGYALVLYHEISHVTERTGRGMSSEPVADYNAIYKLRYMLRHMRRRYDDRTMENTARRNIKMISKGRNRQSRKHPDARCRMEIYKSAIKKRKIPNCARRYM
jgi:hypothetical protein